MEEYSGFDLSILAFGKFVQRLPESEKSKTKLIIVGSGPEKELLKQNSIRIAFCSRGCLIDIGCKSIPFETIEAARTYRR